MASHILDIPKDQRHTDLSLARALGLDKATVCRWRLKGILLSSGDRLRLKYHRVGKRAYIHPDDAKQFIDELSNADEQARASSASRAHGHARSPRRSSTRAERAEREAESLGI